MISAVFTIFTILSDLRRGLPAGRIWRTFYHFGKPLTPRLPFWLHLCRQAALLDTSSVPHPARQFKAWLTLPPAAQTLELLAAWQQVPTNAQDRCARRALLRRLKQAEPLIPRDQRNLPGLQALGLCQQGRLTAWGEIVLLDRPAPAPARPAAWRSEAGALFIPFPPDWPLLWELERFLAPEAPGRYPLTVANLRRAVQRGPAEELIAILEKGCAAPLPPGLRAAILEQPVLNVHTGIVLEFSEPAELQRLRRSPALREHFDHILSPRHVCVRAEHAPRLLALLERRGIYVRTEIQPRRSQRRTKETHQILRDPLCTSRFKPETTHRMELLQEYLRLQQALDILYHAPGGVRPEQRRITPLLIEERGGQVYVIAYCHTRRARRTFRLDRIEIPGGEAI